MFDPPVTISPPSVELWPGEEGENYHGHTEDQGSASYKQAHSRIPANKYFQTETILNYIIT